MTKHSRDLRSQLLMLLAAVVLIAAAILHHYHTQEIDASVRQMRTEIDRMRALQQELEDALESVPPSIGKAREAIVGVACHTGETTSVVGCFVTTQGMVLTVARGVRETGTTCTVVDGAASELRTYRVVWRERVRNLALLVPDEPLTAPAHALAFAEAGPMRGDTVALAALSGRTLTFRDQDVGVPSVSAVFRTEFRTTVIAVLPENSWLLLDHAIDRTMLGAAIIDRHGKLAAIATERRPSMDFLGSPTSIAVTVGEEMRQVVADLETSAARTNTTRRH